ncbi:MAG: transcription antitermination factor NusB [Deltaproteobacteria bacterium]|nr:transcription antitermination factor NusB [Deltaproteobacteria bacterium]MBW2123150.1 transcription antitermination factor NusB [Deltaproteobacteria bacterium]
MGIRRRGRESALQVLYQIDVTRLEAGEALKLFWDNFIHEEEAREFCECLVLGVVRHREEIDRLIEGYAEHWKLSRMTRIDRNILRIAVYELLHCQDIPPKVTINEAVEIGKRFGSEESGAFINGILDRVTQRLGLLNEK